MIMLAAAIAGGVWGAHVARRRGGGPKDIAQYAAAHAMAFGLAGFVAGVLVQRVFF